MAFADLNFTAALWRGRGLRWLAAPVDLPPGLTLMGALTAELPMARPPQQAARPAPERPKAAGPRENTRAPRPREEAPPATGTGRRWRPLAPEELPGHWRSRLVATRPGRVVWTYWALAQDLAGAGATGGADARAARRAFLARLLRDLAHPAGTHTFWPACLPEAAPDALTSGPASGGGTAFAAHPEAFWAGAAHLGCRAVIVMGSLAVRALGLPAEARPLAQLRWRGQLVLVLRDVDALAGDEARYAPTLAFLRQGLAPAVRHS